MKNPLQFLFRSRDKPRDAVSGAPTFYFGTSASGKAVNPRNVVQVSTVYACVRVIAETIASLPFGVYEEQGTIGTVLFVPKGRTLRSYKTRGNSPGMSFSIMAFSLTRKRKQIRKKFVLILSPLRKRKPTKKKTGRRYLISCR